MCDNYLRSLQPTSTIILIMHSVNSIMTVFVLRPIGDECHNDIILILRLGVIVTSITSTYYTSILTSLIMCRYGNVARKMNLAGIHWS